MKRRKFIKKAVIKSAQLGLMAGLYTWQVEPFWLEYVYRKMRIKNLPKKLIGKTLMQISDLHVGDRFDYQFLIDSFAEAQKMKPDFVVYTGDFVNYETKKQLKQLDEVAPHLVRGKLGTVGVLGNHDYGVNYSNQQVANCVTNSLQKVGVKILSNRQVKISGLNFIGFDDYWSPNFAPMRVMKKINHKRANIVLCHNPDVCDLNVWNGYKGWILAGHTHGGQCKPPFLKPPLLPVENKKYTAGQIDLEDGRMLYINRAIGHLRQVRFNVRPEITVFNLQRDYAKS